MHGSGLLEVRREVPPQHGQLLSTATHAYSLLFSLSPSLPLSLSPSLPLSFSLSLFISFSLSLSLSLNNIPLD